VDTGSHRIPAMSVEPESPVPSALSLDTVTEYDEYTDEVGVDQLNGHSEEPIALLPQRNPGASGISGGAREFEDYQAYNDELPEEDEDATSFELDSEFEPEEFDEPVLEQRQAPVDTSPFFASRAQASTNGVHPHTEPDELHEPDLAPLADAQPLPEAHEATATAGSDDAIYQKMLSEWLVDPTELAKSSDLNWESVWDHGWEAAEAAEEAPVASHTEHGLPVRDPGARLVPGAAGPSARHSANGVHTNGGAHRSHDDVDEVESAAEFGTGAHAIPVRDPEAVRTSIASHFSGVHAARSHAAQETRGTDSE
jgi:hypothetical protein